MDMPTRIKGPSALVPSKFFHDQDHFGALDIADICCLPCSEYPSQKTTWMGQGPSHLTKIPISAPGSNTMNPADFGFTSETIKVEHGLTINLGDKWDRPIRKMSESLTRLGSHWAESFRIIAIGLSAYFVLSGLAKLVAATKATDSDGSFNIKDRSARRTRSSKRSKDKTTSADKSVASEIAFTTLSDQEANLADTEGAPAPAATEI